MKPLILVVDDDGDLRTLLASFLEESGYPVLEAPNAHEALLLLERNPDVALLLTDIVMPAINGFVLADMAMTRWPQLRVLYTSGLTDLRDVGEQPGIYHGRMLPKPYHSDDLLVAVEQALNEPSFRTTAGNGTRPRRHPPCSGRALKPVVRQGMAYERR
jgi:DNA-binding NtrC family response regulator